MPYVSYGHIERVSPKLALLSTPNEKQKTHKMIIAQEMQDIAWMERLGLGAVILYLVFKQFVPDILAFAKGKREEKAPGHDAQSIINKQNKDSIEKLNRDLQKIEEDIKALRSEVSEIGKSTGIAIAILERVEAQIK